MLLEIKDAVLAYGKIEALHGISVQVERGRGRLADRRQRRRQDLDHARPLRRARPLAGPVVFDGKDVTQLRADERVRRGRACPGGSRHLSRHDGTENLRMGAYTRKDKAAIEEDYDRVFGLFPRLEERRKQVAGTMSGGEQQMLAIGRALMARPKLLCLDEPSMGLAPKLIQQIFEIIAEIASQGTTILVVEQNAQQALSHSDRAYVLETGEITKSGTGKDLLADDSIREAYLGVA